MVETISLPLLWFKEQCKIRLFDVLERYSEHQVRCSWGFLWGQLSLGRNHIPSQAKVGSIQSLSSIDGSTTMAMLCLVESMPYG